MVNNVRTLNFKPITSEQGCLIPLEVNQDIPFDVNRVYYIYNVPQNERRGFHSHTDLEQVLVCMSGEVSVLVEDGLGSQVIKLSNPSDALYIGPMVWREMFDFSENSVLVVFASRHYDASDYEHDYERFKLESAEYFSNKKGK